MLLHLKHAKHSGKSVPQPARRKRTAGYPQDSVDIVSKTPKTGKFLTGFARFLFVLAGIAMFYLIIHLTISNMIPLKYILVIVGLFGFFSGLQMWFVSSHRKKTAKRVISMILSVVVIAFSLFPVNLLSAFRNSLSKLQGGEVDALNVDVVKKPFIVYLSGIDNTSGKTEIADKGLSDVNMVVVVNPLTAKVLMVSTPRDYYVPLWGDTDKMDKLTHAGTKGVECSMQTLEAVYGIKFNYYVKVNFKSLVDIVDTIGGITVNSDYDFSSRHSYTGTVYTFKKGENTVMGDQALAFARERESFKEGDRQRGKDQQIVIQAIYKKVVSPSMLNATKLGKLLDCITLNTKTNLNQDEISGLVKYELAKTPDWDIQSVSVDGTGDSCRTYSYPRQNLYVMRPNQDTVDNAKAQIQAVLNGQDPVTSDISSVSSGK